MAEQLCACLDQCIVLQTVPYRCFRRIAQNHVSMPVLSVSYPDGCRLVKCYRQQPPNDNAVPDCDIVLFLSTCSVCGFPLQRIIVRLTLFSSTASYLFYSHR